MVLKTHNKTRFSDNNPANTGAHLPFISVIYLFIKKEYSNFFFCFKTLDRNYIRHLRIFIVVDEGKTLNFMEKQS